jgi:hypothetical protein
MIERFWTFGRRRRLGQFDRYAGSDPVHGRLRLVACHYRGRSWWVLAHPEALGFVMAGQLVGRYTGFRLVELQIVFKALMNDPVPSRAA